MDSEKHDTFEAIYALVNAVTEETETVEYLRNLEDSDIEQKICGMANAYGGTILIGIGEQRKGKEQKLEALDLVGLQDKEGLKDMIANKIRRCEPIPRLDFQKVAIPKIEDKVVVVVSVAQATDKPIIASNGVFYFRVQTMTHPMPRQMIKSFFIQTEEKRARFSRLRFEVSRLIEACKKSNQLNGRYYPPPFQLYDLSRLRQLIGENYDVLHDETFNNLLSRVDLIAADIDVIYHQFTHEMRISEFMPGSIRKDEYQKVCNEWNQSLMHKVGELHSILAELNSALDKVK